MGEGQYIGIGTYTDGLTDQLWELAGVHLTSGREGRIATDLALEVELGLAVLYKFSNQ